MTLRELLIAAERKRDDDWNHTAKLVSELGTAFSGQRISFDAAHPFRETMPINLNDPAVDYDRLVAQKDRNGKSETALETDDVRQGP